MFGYIGKHWRGEFPLPQSYWVNGVLALMPFNVYLRVVEAVFQAEPPESFATVVYAYLLPVMALLPCAVWSGVGIWRSAGNRIAEGRYGWAWVARIVILFNLLALIMALITAGRVTYAIGSAAHNEDIAKSEVILQGDQAVFTGELTHAVEDKLTPMLKNLKVVRLVLSSNGGLILPALRLAKLVHERHLFVVAIGQCDSACAILLAAGGERAITPVTQVGFHSGTVEGFAPGELPNNHDEDKYYKGAGLTEAMIAEIHRHHGLNDSFNPTLHALIDCGFLTQILVPKQHLYEFAGEWCAANAGLCGNSGKKNHSLNPNGDDDGK